MTAVATPPRPAPTSVPEALIEEARQRQRRRRLLSSLALGVMLVAGASTYLLVDRSDDSGRTRAPAAAPIAAGCPPAPAPHFGSLGAVAYVHGRTLRVVDLASGQDRALANVPPNAPVNWSADGHWLTAGSTIVAAATGASCVPFGRSASLTWFPNRDALIVGTKQGRYLVASAGHRPRPLLPKAFSPAGPAPVSPDGTKIAASGPLVIASRKPPSLWISDIRTGRRFLLWSPRSWDVGPPVAARWSPDGRWVLFEADEQGSGSIAADGLPLLALPVEGPTVHVEPRVLTPPDFLQNCGPTALVVSAGLDRYVSASKRVDLIAPPAWRPRNVSRDATRSWYAASCSPGGKLIAGTTTPNRDEGGFDFAERSIWLLSRDGANRRLLVGSPGDRLSDEQLRWSRDGRWILYIEHRAHFDTSARLYLIDVTTGARRGPFGGISSGNGFYGYHDWNELAAWYQPR